MLPQNPDGSIISDAMLMDDPFGVRDEIRDRDTAKFDEDGDPSPEVLEDIVPDEKVEEKKPTSTDTPEEGDDDDGEEVVAEDESADKDDKKEGADEQGDDEDSIPSLKVIQQKKEGAEKKTEEKPGEKRSLRDIGKYDEDTPEEGDDDGEEGESDEGDSNVYDFSDLTPEEVDEAIDNLLKSGQEVKEDGGKVDSKTTKELLSAQKDLQKALKTSEELGAVVKQAKRVATQYEAQLASLQEQISENDKRMEVLTPYTEALQSNEQLSEAIRYLAQSARAKDEAAKNKNVDHAIDNLYSFLEEHTGLEIRKLVDANAKQKHTPKEKTGKGGSVEVKSKNEKQDDESLQILKGITF